MVDLQNPEIIDKLFACVEFIYAVNAISNTFFSHNQLTTSFSLKNYTNVLFKIINRQILCHLIFCLQLI